MIDEDRLEMWDRAWESWDDLERQYRIGRAWSSRNLWVLITLGLGIWQVLFGCYTWNDGSVATGLMFWIGCGVLGLSYLSVWEVQAHLDYLRWKRSSEK